MARILFVDDDPFTRETLTKAVELFGHQAIVAGSGEEALAAALQQAPDLIFVDLSLPDMDGLALLSSLQKQQETAQIPTLVLSASAEEDIEKQAKACGAIDYLSKPLRLQYLMEIIRKYTVG